MSNRAATEIDAQIGRRIRERRMVLGVNQEQLSAALGVSFQQVQKYEKGQSRISAGRLMQIARMFDTPVGYFFKDAIPAEYRDDDASHLDVQAMSRESLRLCRDFDRIRDPSTRQRLSELVRALASEE